MRSRASRRDIHFVADEEFVSMLERGARMAAASKAAVLREAVERYVREMEREALRLEMEEAYTGLRELNLDLNEEMRAADAAWPTRRKT